MSDWQPTCDLRIKYRENAVNGFKVKVFVHQQKWTRRIVDDHGLTSEYEEEWRNIPHVPESET